jgi:hypothetical protein
MLESRQLMAGNVTAEVRDGHLIVLGDDAANGVEIVGTGRAGEYLVIGHARAGAATTIGGAVGPRLVTGVTGRVDVRLGAGDDGIEIHNLTINGDLMVDGQQGNDTVIVGDKLGTTRVGVNLILIDSHIAGDNRTSVIGSTLIGNAAAIGFAAGYEGNNRLVIDGVTKQVVVGANLNTGHAQHVTISRLFCRTGNLLVSTGRDVNTRDTIRLSEVNCAGRISIVTGRGSDTVEVHDTTAGSLFVHAHEFRFSEFDDHDRVVLEEVRFAGDVTIGTGGGWDVVEILNLGAPRLDIHTGDGFDQVTVRLSHLDELFAGLGAGNDSMTLADTSISGTATLDGGDGWLDDFYDHGGNRIGSLSVHDFELPLDLPWPL